jgi:MFS family permease
MVAGAERRLLLLLGLATFFEGYGRSLIVIVLPYVQQSFGVSAAALSYILAVISAGSFGALLLGMVTDRVGRRRVLLGSILGYALFGSGTAFAASIAALIAWQTIARLFQEGALTAAVVIAAEEMPAERRGAAQGVIGTVNSCGAGFAALLLAAIAYVPGGWRGLAAVSLVPLLFLPFLAREIRESRRWANAERSRSFAVPAAYRARLAVAFGLAFVAMSYDVAGFAFTSYVPVTKHGWSPGAVSAMIVVAGGIGLPGWMLGGELADRIGRRPSAALFLIGLGGAEMLFFLGGEHALWAAFGLMVFCQAGKTTVLRSWMTELFPTSIRGTTTAWVTVGGTLGGMVGLAVAGSIASAIGDIGGALSIVAGASVAVASLATLFLPETSGLELELVAPEAAPPELS